MAYEYRDTRDYVFGTLSAQATISDITLSSTSFTGLPTDYSTGTPGKYLPLVLHDPALGVYEVVWVNSHVAASANVGVVRGKEGSVARAWPSGTQILNGPTVRDVMDPTPRASLPADAHLGLRVPVSDEGIVLERLLNTWGPSVGVALPSDVAGLVADSLPPAGAVITARSGGWDGTTNVNGQLSVSFRQPFPNACLIVVANVYFLNGASAVNTAMIETKTASGFGAILWNGPGTVAGNSASRGGYIALGY